ncbi:MAG TPA: PadR family transcriptional regulator [Thermoanaerobaculia bacterium]|nr:PadR family transcriptional regulator [Thermoanaerobaculia bacterium]
MTSRKHEHLHGALDMLVLAALRDGPEHGFGIARRLERDSDDELVIEEGSLYPALYRLERQGLVRSQRGRSENNRPARFYRLTPLGKRRLGVEVESWRRFVEAVSRTLPSP